jgi:prepilin-type N-terminal cleavage/methylation domain-containing protein
MRGVLSATAGGFPAAFTLIEVIVALAITGIILGGAAALVGAMLDTERGIRARTEAAVGASNGERLLVELAGNLLPSEGEEIALAGTRSSVAFRSRCVRGGGWSAACSVQVVLQDQRIALQRSGEATIDLPIRDPRGFLYLAESAGGGTWVPAWESSVPPKAIGLLASTDTIILPVGIRP